MTKKKRWVDTNRAWWDERVPSHAKSAFYDVKAFRQGGDVLRPCEADEHGVEIHPFLWGFADTGEPELRYSYFGDVESTDAFGSYTDRKLKTKHNHVFEHNWSIGPVVTAAIKAGLNVELVAEHEIGVEQKWPFMVRGRDGYWRMPKDRPSIPQLWSLRARKP